MSLSKVTKLTQRDFNSGTYRITNPGTYIIQEDITFHPNPNDHFLPKKAQSKIYPAAPGPYTLGFFSAITIETSGVKLNLNGYTIQQSLEHYCRQRFFNIISLSSSPFIPKQGPGKFGSTIQSANNTAIYNGILGLTSHSGIHGNNNTDISIHNITIEDFEVGGITLNGANKVSIEDCTIINSLGSKRKVPFNGRFSSSMFLLQALRQAIQTGEQYREISCGPFKETTLSLHDWLKQITDVAIQFILDVGLYEAFTSQKMSKNSILDEAFHYFGNPSGNPDGSAIYGILFNRIGVAVNEFGACSPECIHDKNMSRSIKINRVSISHLLLEPKEVVGLLQVGKPDSFQKDFSGSLIMISSDSWFEGDNIYQPDKPFIQESRKYKYDKILATQVHLYVMSTELKRRDLLGAAHIDVPVIEWVKTGNKLYRGIGTARNTDIMGHVMKGIVAVRLDSVVKIDIDNVSIGDLSNTGRPCIQTLNRLEGYLDGNTHQKNRHIHSADQGHPKSTDVDMGYCGNIIRAISNILVSNARIQNVGISRLSSLNGIVFGIDVMRYNNTHFYKNIKIDQLSSGPFKERGIVPYHTLVCTRTPQQLCKSIGIYVRMENTTIELQNISTSRIVSTDISESIVIEAPCVIQSIKIIGQGKPSALTYEINKAGDLETRDFK